MFEKPDGVLNPSPYTAINYLKIYLPLYILHENFMTGFSALNDIFLLTYNIVCYYSLLFVNKFYITQLKTFMEGNTNIVLSMLRGSITMQ